MHYKEKPYRLLGTAWHSETQEALTLYECLYPNERGSLWVRPEAMFHETVETPRGTIGRFRAIPLEIKATDKLDDSTWVALEPLLRSVFGEADRARIEQRLESRGDGLILTGFFEGDAVGFKIGHRGEEGVFESWLGGVRRDRRGLGVGGELMEAQHVWARERGYRKVRTKSLNRWAEMLILNLRRGFQVIGTETSERGLKIVLEKSLDDRLESSKP